MQTKIAYWTMQTRGGERQNAFSQHTSYGAPDLLLVLKRQLLPNRYELTVTYGSEYWSLAPNPRLPMFNAAARQQYHDYYGELRLRMVDNFNIIYIIKLCRNLALKGEELVV